MSALWWWVQDDICTNSCFIKMLTVSHTVYWWMTSLLWNVIFKVYHLILCSEDTCYHSTVSLLWLMSVLPASLRFLHCPSIGFHQALSITSALDSLQKIFSQESPRGLGPAVLLPLQITCYLPSNKSARLMVSAGLLDVWLQNWFSSKLHNHISL